MAKTPVAISVFLCERVIVEEGTRNITLVNCFRERRVNQFPSEVVQFSLFALLTDGMGTMPLVVSIQRLDTLDEIHRLTSQVKFASPLREYWCRPTIQPSFPVPGHYQASLLANN